MPASLTLRSGHIKDRQWYGQDGMEHVRTRKEPKQSIPTFAETIALLMQASRLHRLPELNIMFHSPRTSM